MKTCEHLRVVGTHKEIGEQIGAHFKSMIKKATDDSLNNELAWLLEYSKKSPIRDIIGEFLAASKQHYPQYIEEIQGLSEGAQVDFNLLFLLHLEPELFALKHKESSEEKASTGSTSLPPEQTSSEGIPAVDGTAVCPAASCTTICLNTEEHQVLAHNEDVICSMRRTGYVITAEIRTETEGKVEEEYTAYTNPGTLAGNSVSVNGHGLSYTLNMLSDERCDYRGALPRRFINRAIMAAKSLEEVQRILRNTKFGQPFNLTLSFVDPESIRRFYSIETAPSCDRNKITVTRLGNGVHYHTNNYQHRKSDVYQMTDRSSTSRLKQLSTLLPGKLSPPDGDTVDVILEVLSNDCEEDYPIYRSGNKPDYLSTAVTGVFDYKNRTLSLYADKPHKNAPVFTTSLL